jgi:hypothetical protein
MSDRDLHAATFDGVAATPANPISLADVINLRVIPHWAEAVAVVEELCAVLSSAGPGAMVIPQLPDVVITSRGAVMVRKGARGGEDVVELGRILSALLDPGAAPMALRLFAAHAMDSGRGKYATVSAYAEALAYYARPGRRELIRALYDRCLETSVDDTPPTVETVGLAREQQPVRDRRIPRRVRVFAILAMCAAGATAAAWAWGWDARVTPSMALIRTTVTSAAETVRQQLGVPAAGQPAREPETVIRSGLRARGRQSQPTPREDIVPGPRAAVPLLLPPALEAGGGPSIIEGGLATPPVVATPMPAVSPLIVEDQTVYTIASAGIEPPVLLHPKLPPFPVVPPRASGTNTMELLIDTSGRVEHVQLVSEPVRMQDMTLLSAAKVWRFHPALKAGRPVRYRLSLSWIVSPP